ncbi:Ubiquitin-conjugating enzyme E2 C [Nowakowskiella sp. JEL0078]|nr:Ubiquitin-conjugating enzyme E2 C [Nowakowskiella sp. JEL0078]
MNGESNNSVTKRLPCSLQMNPAPGVSAFPDDNNLMNWIASVEGPSGTPFENLTYKLSLKFPKTYPFSAPAVTFETGCFHPNVSVEGAICLDILKDKWSAIYNVQTVLISLQSLLGGMKVLFFRSAILTYLAEPNNESPLNPEAADLWNDKEKFRKQVEIHHSH